MNSFKIPYNQIENKIRQFKEGFDYRLTEEKYHAPDGNHKGYTTRNYQINSPQLQKIVQEYLNQQTAIFMQFDSKSGVFISERMRPDNSGKGWNEKYHAIVDDENGDSLNYGYYNRPQEGEGWSLLINYGDRTQKKKEGFNQYYQAAKKVWEQKGSPIQNTPPSGTKCWNCYKVISDEDIATGRYKVENSRYGLTSQEKRLSLYKTFEHVKGVCKPLEYDCASRNNYRYHSELKKTWLEYPKKPHEYSCQDCLNRMWNEINSNLIYLETWTKEQKELIASHKQILAEIEARLGVLEKTGEYHNCGIKKCCAEHDKPDHSKPKSINDNKGLIAVGPVEKDFSEPEKPVFDRQEILNWMKEKGIVEISIDPSNRDNLLIKYANGKVNNLEIANDLPQEWGNFLKREVSASPISLNSQNSPTKNNNKWGGGVIATFSLLAVGLIVVVGILIYRHQQLKRE